MQRLSPATLAGLPPDVAVPGYDRRACGIGIVHLGIGAFHRAHQAVYTDDVLARHGGDWAIAGVSLRHADVRDALAPQDGLYTLARRDADGERLRVIGAVRRVLAAPEDPAAVLTLLTAPATRIVSLTVTEKGYCHDPATRALNEADPAIVHDLAKPARPRTAIGLLVEALARRRQARVPPFTVLCCDNLPDNGATVAGLIGRLAELRAPALGHWIAETVACPNTMVDRIVPATTPDDRREIACRLRMEDAWPVVTEPFTQWVIEDRFPGGRPRWEEAGAELVGAVRPYEIMKLRLLNGSHSTLAYLGYLAGYETIAETMVNPAFVRLIAGLMNDEVGPTLHVPAGTDLAAYGGALLQRFANPALRHRTWQIAMDGSQKLPQRLLDTVRDRLAAGAPLDRLALGVAAWMRYVAGVDEHGALIDVRDPLADRLACAARPLLDRPGELAGALLAVEDVFGRDLPRAAPFVTAVTRALTRLRRDGARHTVEHWSDPALD